MALPLLLAGLGVVLGLGVLGVWQYSSGASERSVVAERSAVEPAEPASERLRRGAEERLMAMDFGRRLAVRLRASGAGITPVAFVAAASALGIAGFLVSLRALPLLLALVFGALCVRGAWAWIDYKLGQRREAFLGQLPDLARVLANASSAGLATRSAVELAASELEEPAATEMGIVAEEMRIGQSLDGALANLERRLPSRDVGVLMNTLVIQQRSGGDLVRALQEIADTLDTRRDLYREIKTVMASSVATGYVVGAMGLVALVVLNVVSPGVIADITSTWPGRIAFLISAALYTVGWLMVRRVTRIEI
jgi:tight adherence protein B